IARLDAVVLDDLPLPEVPVEAARVAMLVGVRELGINALNWTRDARDLQARMEFVRRAAGENSDWPAVDDASLAETLEDWLAPWLDGVTRKDHLSRISLSEA